MRKHRTTLFDKCKVAAQATIDLINHRQTPDRVSDAVIETLIEMSAETLLQIWNKETGINLITLAGLYSLQKRGDWSESGKSFATPNNLNLVALAG